MTRAAAQGDHGYDRDGRSIMPGKTNPTQCEALTMVAPHSFLELNVFNPVIIVSLLQSCLLPADAAEGCAADTVNRPEPNREHIAENRAKTPMLVTALNPADRL